MTQAFTRARVPGRLHTHSTSSYALFFQFLLFPIPDPTHKDTWRPSEHRVAWQEPHAARAPLWVFGLGCLLLACVARRWGLDGMGCRQSGTI